MSRALLVLPVFLMACAAAPRPGPPLHPEPEGGALVRQGEQVFMAKCEGCHPGGAEGFGPAIVRSTPLPDAQIRAQVRDGIGQMPSFDHESISDADLEALIAYLNALQATIDQPPRSAVASGAPR